MNVGEIIAMYRTEVSDIERPYLWTDEEVLAYLNDAYTMLIRFMGGVPDATSAISEIDVTIGQKEAAISEAVIRVVRAFRESDGAELSVIESTDVPLVRNSAGKVALMRIGSHAGPIEYVIIGTDRNMVSFHPVPNTADTIKLQVRRMPLVELAAESDVPSDIGAEHHLHLLKWMKSMGYRKQDADTLDMEKAQLNESLFLQYCEQSTYEQERMRRKSRISLRTERDMRNPMLATSTTRAYGQSSAPSRGESQG